MKTNNKYDFKWMLFGILICLGCSGLGIAFDYLFVWMNNIPTNSTILEVGIIFPFIFMYVILFPIAQIHHKKPINEQEKKTNA